MRDYISVGPSPCAEDCVQVGEHDYGPRARTECYAFIRLIRRVLGSEPDGTNLIVKAFPHDFGTYYEVVCYYNDDDARATEYAFRCEDEAPEHWDEQALAELGHTSRV